MEEFNSLMEKHKFSIDKRDEIDAFIEVIRAYGDLRSKFMICNY